MARPLKTMIRSGGRSAGCGTSAGGFVQKAGSDSNACRPSGGTSACEVVDGLTVLVSADGQVLHNLQTPPSQNHLRLSLLDLPKPTVWLDALFGRVPIKALQDYLDQVDADEGNAIIVNGDGHLDVGTMQNSAPDESWVYVVRRTDPT